MQWEEIAKKKRQSLLDRIPKEWIIPINEIPSANEEPNTSKIIEKYLSNEEIEITNKNLLELQNEILLGKLKSYDITKAYCHRASLIHQITFCLSEIFFDKALNRAKELDNYFNKNNGKVLGPLHGIPISCKDQINIEGIDSGIGYISFLNKPKKLFEQSNIVNILLKSGAIFYVKTTVPPAMMSCETISNIYGYTYNSINRKLSSGGSSGGEGSLLGAKGSPIGIGTDIGGSIRIPSCFQGLYGLRPSHGRIPYYNITNSMTGQCIINSVVGPMSNSIDSIELFFKTILSLKPWQNDAQVSPIPYKEYKIINNNKDINNNKISFGIMKWDEIVMPHPPVLRAIQLVKNALKLKNFQIIDWNPQNHLHGINIVNKVFRSDGYKEITSNVKSSGEPMIPQQKSMLNMASRALTNVNQFWDLENEKYNYQQMYFDYWNNTSKLTSSGEPIDAWILPVWAGAGFKPNESFLCPYTYPPISNVLDVPSIVIPITFVDKNIDKKDPNYIPANDLDKENYDYYDPELYHGTPVALQLVVRRLEEEKAIALARVVENALKDFF